MNVIGLMVLTDKGVSCPFVVAICIWFLEEGREWRLPGLLYADDLVLCGKSEKYLKVMIRH